MERGLDGAWFGWKGVYGQLSRFVRKTSENSISTDDATTAVVDALPTSTEPPSTLYPQYEATLVMMNANTSLFIIDIHTNHELN